MKVLFIGGTGTISHAVSELALAQGLDVWLFHRGTCPALVPEGARVILGDIRDPTARQALSEHRFDIVVDEKLVYSRYETGRFPSDADLNKIQF